MGRGYQRRGRSRERQIRESYTLQLRRGLEGCLAARCGRESLRAGEGAGRWAAALATVTEWGCRSLMVFNVAACGLPELPAAEETPQSSRAEVHVHESREDGGLAQLFAH